VDETIDSWSVVRAASALQLVLQLAVSCLIHVGTNFSKCLEWTI